jgi:hypothetical protein
MVTQNSGWHLLWLLFHQNETIASHFFRFNSFQQKKPEPPKQPAENESKTGSKTTLPPSTAFDKNGQKLHCPRSTPPQIRLPVELKKLLRRFKSSRPDLRTGHGMSRRGFLLFTAFSR